MSNGDVLVVDAAGNDIIRVTPEGDATTMARFDLETVSTCRRGVLLGQHPRSRLHGRGGRPHRHPGHRHQPEERALYVFELAADGVLAFEAGFETGEFPPAGLLRIRTNNTVLVTVRPEVAGDGRALRR